VDGMVSNSLPGYKTRDIGEGRGFLSKRDGICLRLEHGYVDENNVKRAPLHQWTRERVAWLSQQIFLVSFYSLRGAHHVWFPHPHFQNWVRKPCHSLQMLHFPPFQYLWKFLVIATHRPVSMVSDWLQLQRAAPFTTLRVKEIKSPTMYFAASWPTRVTYYLMGRASVSKTSCCKKIGNGENFSTEKLKGLNLVIK
jgi:hypothetical protein